jgi:uncharacterized protein YqeY
MSFRDQIQADLTAAIRSSDGLRKRTLRMALSAVKLADVEKGVRLDDAAILSVIQKEIKSRRESIVDAERAARKDLIAEAEAEIGVLESYLPRQLSEAELEALARTAIAEVGATSPKEMGQVMKVLMPRLQGQADGAQASQVVRRLLG